VDAALASGRGHRRDDQLGELAGASDAGPAALLDDAPGDTPAVALLAELVERVRQLLLRHLVEPPLGGELRRGVHAHV